MGILGGLTGLAGILTTVWCGMRGWGKDEQRAVFQPVGVFVIGLPVLFAETWGLKLYGHLDEAGFRKIVLILLLLSGIALFVPAIARLLPKL